jgi:hypothetical protein
VPRTPECPLENLLTPILIVIKATPDTFDRIVRELKSCERGWRGDYLRDARGLSEALGTRGEVPSAPASVKALRPLRGAQDRAALTDASAPGGALS